LSRDLGSPTAPGEVAEAGLNALIASQHAKRVRERHADALKDAVREAIEDALTRPDVSA
jgi:hypothetical protein